MYNRVGPSELAVRQQETMAANIVQEGVGNTGRRPQTQENMGNRGGRQNYRGMMQMRNFNKVTSVTGKPSTNDAGSSFTGDQQNKSTQGGSNFKYTNGRDYDQYQGILSQTIQQDPHPFAEQTAKKRSRSRYGNNSNTATRIGRYRRQKIKTSIGLLSTIQLQEKLSLLSYHPPGAHLDDRIRCSNRVNSNTQKRRKLIIPGMTVPIGNHDQDDFGINEDKQSTSMNQKNGHNFNRDEDHDSICISTGEKDIQKTNENTIIDYTRSKGSDNLDSAQNIVSRGMSIEEGNDPSQINIITGMIMLDDDGQENRMSVTPRGPSLRMPRGSTNNKKNGQGNVFFAPETSMMLPSQKLDTVQSSINEAGESTHADFMGGEPLTQREKTEHGYFDSIQSGPNQHQANNNNNKNAAQITVSDEQQYQSMKSPIHSIQSNTARRHIKGKQNKFTTTQEISDEDGLRFLSKQMHSVQEHYNRQASKLYSGKVLIDRERTRDIMATKIRASKRCSFQQSVQQTTQQSSSIRQQKKSFQSGYGNIVQPNSPKMLDDQQTFAMTSRHQRETQVDSEFLMSDELLGSSGSQLERNKNKWLQMSLESSSLKQPSSRINYADMTANKRFQSVDQQKRKKKLSPRKLQQQQQQNKQNRIYAGQSSEERQAVKRLIGTDVHSQQKLREQRFMGELQKRAQNLESMKYEQNKGKRKEAADKTLGDVFAQVFRKIKEQNIELWAVRKIQSWWRKQYKEIQRIAYEKWLPINIDPETCNFSDVDRVLKVLDDYALQKLGKLENEPLLPQIVIIQRAVKSYLVRTRLVRCVRDGIKVCKAIRALQNFSDRAPLKSFFHRYGDTYGEQIEQDLFLKNKQLERARKIEAGEVVSDTSSQKEKKKRKKEVLVQMIRQGSLIKTGPTMRQGRKSFVQKTQSFKIDSYANTPSNVSIEANSPGFRKQPQNYNRRATLGVKSLKSSLLTKRESLLSKDTNNKLSELKNDASLKTIVSSNKTTDKTPVILEDKSEIQSPRSIKKKMNSISSMQGDLTERADKLSQGSGSMLKHRVMTKKKDSIKNSTREVGQSHPKKLQSNLLAQAPIKSRSRRTNFHRIGTGNTQQHYGSKSMVASNDTLHRKNRGLENDFSFEELKMGTLRVSANTPQNRIGGLSIKTVRHIINRECWLWYPPHDKPDWVLKKRNKWRRFENIPKGGSLDDTMKTHEGLSKQKMRQIRRKQFFTFFEGFFDKYPNDSLKLRNLRFQFSKQEKVDLLKKYFRKYFNEKLDTKKSTVESKLESDYNISSVLNQTKGNFDGKLNIIAENFKDAFLGRSEGILNSYGTATMNQDLTDALNNRKKEKMKPAKVLIQSQFVPGKPKAFEDLLQDENRSQRSYNRIDDSSLERLSIIPRERNATILSTEGSKLGGPTQGLITIVDKGQKGSAGDLNDGQVSQGESISDQELSPMALNRNGTRNSQTRYTTTIKEQRQNNQNTAATQEQIERQIKQRQRWKSINPHSFAAPELDENCMEAKLEAQRVQNIQLKAQRAMVTDEFSVGYPAYQDILEKYTPSMIFAGKRATQSKSKDMTGRSNNNSKINDSSSTVGNNQHQQWRLKQQRKPTFFGVVSQ